MIVTEVPATFDPTLPLLVPALPNPLDRRWIADTISADGAVASISDIVAGAAMSQATSGSRPTSGLVDGLRGITFDGADDRLQSAVDLSALTEFTFYTVAKLPALPSALRVLMDAGGSFLGINSVNRWHIGAASNATVAPTAVVADKWIAVGAAVKVVGSGTSIGRIVTSVDTAGVEVLNATYGPMTNAFVVGATGASTAFLGASVREWGIKLGTAHTLAQLAANVAALKAEYGLA